MKKNYLTKLIYLGVVLCLFLASCEKEDSVKPDSAEETFITDAIEKIETVYTEGCIKIEGFNPDYVKTETEAPDYIKQRILEELEASYSKTRVFKSDFTDKVGVLRSGSCGSYPLLEVFMDEEDSDAASSQSGWVGDSYVTTGKNIMLHFCIVNRAFNFYRTTVDYAILNLSSDLYLYYKVDGLQRAFDNEDNDNDNNAELDNVPLSGWVGANYFGGNTRLHFYYFEKDVSSTKDFPNLGISYGTLGRYGNYQGNIYCDDEDNSNNNSAARYDIYGVTSVGDITNIWNAGVNTRLYISKAK